MKENISISDIRTKAKNQLLGNYRMASGAFVLMLVIVYSISSILLNAYSRNVSAFGSAGMSATTDASGKIMIMDIVISNFISIAANIFSDLLLVGFVYILIGITKNQVMKISDLFYGFKNHPDKIIIISTFFSVVRLVLLLPSTISLLLLNNGEVKFAFMTESVVWLVFEIIGNLLYLIFYLNFGLCYLVYLNDSEKSSIECIRESLRLMRGNRVRWFKMLLSFIGYYVLGALSFGIGFMYVIPFVEMANIYFYEDITGTTKEEEVVLEKVQMDYWK